MRAVIAISLLAMSFHAQSSKPATKNFITRPKGLVVRVMTWNAGGNSIFADPGGSREKDAARLAGFRRIIKAVGPDIACIQEVFAPRTAADVAAILDDVTPLANGAKWQSHGVGDAVIVSRYPLSMLGGSNIDHGGGVPRPHSTALVDLPSSFGRKDLFALCTHFQSRVEPKDIKARQAHADVISALIGDLRASDGNVTLPSMTPIVLMGDWNAYKDDPSNHIANLISGTRSDQKAGDAATFPDWDRSPLADAVPRHNGTQPFTYTFGDGSGKPFPNGELDRILFTDSVMQMINGFVLNTTILAPEELALAGLQQGDILRGGRFDHLPVVVDLLLRKR